MNVVVCVCVYLIFVQLVFEFEDGKALNSR